MRVILLILLTLNYGVVKSQACTPQGNEVAFGTNNTWIGYVYDNMNFTNYRGYVNEGASYSPNFDQSFGGNDVTYTTNGCSIATSTFSVRYKLRNNFSSSDYRFVVGGDDGYRLSFDGGATWAIDQWGDHGYQTTTLTLHLSGSHDLVLEYYENGGANRISFQMTQICTPTENTNVYGTNNIWNAYVYDGINFDTYQGMNNVGTTSNPNFDLNFGGDNVIYPTSACGVQTETFSVRFRLQKNFAPGSYQFTVGGDDGYRLSVDGGATWIIDAWVLQTYTVRTSSAVTLSGNQNLVLEYYENNGSNRISFAAQQLIILPTTLESFNAVVKNNDVTLNWATNDDSKMVSIERSNDGINFYQLGTAGDNSTYVDRNINETYFYRLRLISQDGTINYSTVKKITTSNAGMQIYPTIITGNSFSIRTNNLQKNASVIVRNLNGGIIHQQSLGNIRENQTIQISNNQLSNYKGMLLVSVLSDANLIYTSKILVQ